MAKATLTDAQREALRLSKITSAFRKVFGTADATRTDDQRTVWEQLRLMSYRDKPSFLPDKAGALCPLRAALTDGRRALFCDIEANVNFNPPLIEEQQPQPKR